VPPAWLPEGDGSIKQVQQIQSSGRDRGWARSLGLIANDESNAFSVDTGYLLIDVKLGGRGANVGIESFHKKTAP